MNDKIKKVICEYLLKDLTKVEIIYYRDSVWFIDRENRYWYFEYHKVDKHLWWRWSRFTQALKIFSMDAENEQSIFGELVNMILTKKQKLESKYPNKIFKTVGSVMNFEDNDEVGPKNEVKTTSNRWHGARLQVDEVLNCEVETTAKANGPLSRWVDEVLNCEVETTKHAFPDQFEAVDEVLNCEVKTTISVEEFLEMPVDEVLNSVSSAENGADHIMDFILTDGAFYNDEIVTNEVLNFEVETIKDGELIDEDKFMDEVLSVDIETIDYSKTHRLRPVTGALDHNIETSEGVKGNLKYEVRNVLEHTIEINSIEKLKGENPLQDIVVSHILDESDKVTDKLVIKEEEYVKTYSHGVYMCDHLIQNVLDIGVNSIHYDAESHEPLIDGILKKSYNL
jgi:hypothetical protein